MSGAQAALRGREWSPPLAPYVALIKTRVKERQLIIISKAFTALPLERVATMLACSIEDAEKGGRGEMSSWNVSHCCEDKTDDQIRCRLLSVSHARDYYGKLLVLACSVERGCRESLEENFPGILPHSGEGRSDHITAIIVAHIRTR